MIIPPFLKAGMKIGVTAPSLRVTDSLDMIRFGSAKEKLSGAGYGVIETPDVYSPDPDDNCAPAGQRVKEFTDLLENPETGYIVSAKGGDYQYQMLPLMDWDAVRRNPKWIQGYSDNTTLLFKITAEQDIATVYCGNFGDFGMDPWHRSISENLEFIEGKRTSQDSFPYHESGFKDRITGKEGISEDEATFWDSACGDAVFSGRLIGGCMDVLDWFSRENTADPSPFVSRYSGEGIIWFMETYDMDSGRTEKMFARMSEQGWFEGVSGFVFGRPLFFSGGNYRETVCRALGKYDVPVVFGADTGHIAPRMTFINGAYSTFEVSGGKCKLSYDLPVKD